MQDFDITVRCPIKDSFRVQSVAGMFDVALEEKSSQTFTGRIPGIKDKWEIGAIVGSSGSGKTTIARNVYKKYLYEPTDWAHDDAVVDGMPGDSTNKIFKMLTAVGFSSPPSWVNPYRVLSNGEKFRCDLARALLSDQKCVVYDEFTSVVDRNVAKFGSLAVSRSIKSGKIGKKFIAVSCHYDILKWLQPDWIFDTATNKLKKVRLRRPKISIRVYPCSHKLWKMFARYHYLSSSSSPISKNFVGMYKDRPVAFCSVINSWGVKNMRRISRIVVLPDYQGVSIGVRMCDSVAEIFKRQGIRMVITASHPSIINSFSRSELWRTSKISKTGNSPVSVKNYFAGDDARQRTARASSAGRAVVAFEYL